MSSAIDESPFLSVKLTWMDYYMADESSLFKNREAWESDPQTCVKQAMAVELGYQMNSDRRRGVRGPGLPVAPQAPVVRIFGSTPAGQKLCLHLHGAFPYFLIRPLEEVPGLWSDPQAVASLLPRLEAGIEAAFAVSRQGAGSSSEGSGSHSAAVCEGGRSSGGGGSGGGSGGGGGSGSGGGAADGSGRARAAGAGAGVGGAWKRKALKELKVVRGTPMYGYCSEERLFVKVVLRDPSVVNRAAKFLQEGLIAGTAFQPYESHVPFMLQIMVDYNLAGMAYVHLKRAIFRGSLPKRCAWAAVAAEGGSSASRGAATGRRNDADQEEPSPNTGSNWAMPSSSAVPLGQPCEGGLAAMRHPLLEPVERRLWLRGNTPAELRIIAPPDIRRWQRDEDWLQERERASNASALSVSRPLPLPPPLPASPARPADAAGRNAAMGQRTASTKVGAAAARASSPARPAVPPVVAAAAAAVTEGAESGASGSRDAQARRAHAQAPASSSASAGGAQPGGSNSRSSGSDAARHPIANPYAVPLSRAPARQPPPPQPPPQPPQPFPPPLLQQEQQQRPPALQLPSGGAVTGNRGSGKPWVKRRERRWWQRHTHGDLEADAAVADVLNPSQLGRARGFGGRALRYVPSLAEIWDEERGRSVRLGEGSQPAPALGLELGGSQEASLPLKALTPEYLHKAWQKAMGDIARRYNDAPEREASQEAGPPTPAAAAAALTPHSANRRAGRDWDSVELSQVCCSQLLSQQGLRPAGAGSPAELRSQGAAAAAPTAAATVAAAAVLPDLEAARRAEGDEDADMLGDLQFLMSYNRKPQSQSPCEPRQSRSDAVTTGANERGGDEPEQPFVFTQAEEKRIHALLESERRRSCESMAAGSDDDAQLSASEDEDDWEGGGYGGSPRGKGPKGTTGASASHRSGETPPNERRMAGLGVSSEEGDGEAAHAAAAGEAYGDIYTGDGGLDAGEEAAVATRQQRANARRDSSGNRLPPVSQESEAILASQREYEEEQRLLLQRVTENAGLDFSRSPGGHLELSYDSVNSTNDYIAVGAVQERFAYDVNMPEREGEEEAAAAHHWDIEVPTTPKKGTGKTPSSEDGGGADDGERGQRVCGGTAGNGLEAAAGTAAHCSPQGEESGSATTKGADGNTLRLRGGWPGARSSGMSRSVAARAGGVAGAAKAAGGRLGIGPAPGVGMKPRTFQPPRAATSRPSNEQMETLAVSDSVVGAKRGSEEDDVEVDSCARRRLGAACVAVVRQVSAVAAASFGLREAAVDAAVPLAAGQETIFEDGDDQGDQAAALRGERRVREEPPDGAACVVGIERSSKKMRVGGLPADVTLLAPTGSDTSGEGSSSGRDTSSTEGRDSAAGADGAGSRPHSSYHVGDGDKELPLECEAMTPVPEATESLPLATSNQYKNLAGSVLAAPNLACLVEMVQSEEEACISGCDAAAHFKNAGCSAGDRGDVTTPVSQQDEAASSRIEGEGDGRTSGLRTCCGDARVGEDEGPLLGGFLPPDGGGGDGEENGTGKGLAGISYGAAGGGPLNTGGIAAGAEEGLGGFLPPGFAEIDGIGEGGQEGSDTVTQNLSRQESDSVDSMDEGSENDGGSQQPMERSSLAGTYVDRSSVAGLPDSVFDAWSAGGFIPVLPEDASPLLDCGSGRSGLGGVIAGYSEHETVGAGVGKKNNRGIAAAAGAADAAASHKGGSGDLFVGGFYDRHHLEGCGDEGGHADQDGGEGDGDGGGNGGSGGGDGERQPGRWHAAAAAAARPPERIAVLQPTVDPPPPDCAFEDLRRYGLPQVIHLHAHYSAAADVPQRRHHGNSANDSVVPYARDLPAFITLQSRMLAFDEAVAVVVAANAAASPVTPQQASSQAGRGLAGTLFPTGVTRRGRLAGGAASAIAGLSTPPPTLPSSLPAIGMTQPEPPARGMAHWQQLSRFSGIIGRQQLQHDAALRCGSYHGGSCDNSMGAGRRSCITVLEAAFAPPQWDRVAGLARSDEMRIAGKSAGKGGGNGSDDAAAAEAGVNMDANTGKLVLAQPADDDDDASASMPQQSFSTSRQQAQPALQLSPQPLSCASSQAVMPPPLPVPSPLRLGSLTGLQLKATGDLSPQLPYTASRRPVESMAAAAAAEGAAIESVSQASSSAAGLEAASTACEPCATPCPRCGMSPSPADGGEAATSVAAADALRAAAAAVPVAKPASATGSKADCPCCRGCQLFTPQAGDGAAWRSPISPPVRTPASGSSAPDHNGFGRGGSSAIPGSRTTLLSVEILAPSVNGRTPDPRSDSVAAVVWAVHDSWQASDREAVEERTGAIIVSREGSPSGNFAAKPKAAAAMPPPGTVSPAAERRGFINGTGGSSAATQASPGRCPGCGTKDRARFCVCGLGRDAAAHGTGAGGRADHAPPGNGTVAAAASGGIPSSDEEGDSDGEPPGRRALWYGLGKGVDVVEVDDERQLMLALVQIFRRHDPDIVVGWEIQGSSLGYLLERGMHIGDARDGDDRPIALARLLSRVPLLDADRRNEWDDWGREHNSGIWITGRNVLNLWRLMRHETKLPIYTRQFVVQAVLKRRLPEYSQAQMSRWFASPPPRRALALSHLLATAALNIELICKVDMIGRTSEMARLFGIDFFSVLSRGSQFRVESVMLRVAKPENLVVVSPSRQQVASQAAMEVTPLIMEPQDRFYTDPVVVLDFQSLYPSMVIAYNLCFSTCMGRLAPPPVVTKDVDGHPVAAQDVDGHTTGRLGVVEYPERASSTAFREAGLGGRQQLSQRDTPESPRVSRRGGVSADGAYIARDAQHGSVERGKGGARSAPMPPQHASATSQSSAAAAAQQPSTPVTGPPFVAPTRTVFCHSSQRLGVLPRMLREILETRVMLKGSMKRAKQRGERVLARTLDARQYALKMIANVTYGYTAASFTGRMPMAELADAIVQCGRGTLQHAIHMVDNHPDWRARVVYGDTDSLFVLLEGRTKEEAFKIGAEIARDVGAANPADVVLKLEKVYLPCIPVSKKRYVGFSYESPTQMEPSLDAKGIEMVRRDQCPLTIKMQERCLRTLFTTKDVSQVKAYCVRQWTKILSERAGIADFIFAKEVRPLHQYASARTLPPAAIVAAKRLQRDPRAVPRRGERTRYVVVHGPPGAPLMDLVVDPQELMSAEGHGLRINGKYYIEKAVLPPLDRLFTNLGVKVWQWYREMQRPAARAHPKAEARARANKANSHKSRVITGYFLSDRCQLCGAHCADNACQSCRASGAAVATAMMRLNLAQRAVSQLAAICSQCSGLGPLGSAGSQGSADTGGGGGGSRAGSGSRGSAAGSLKLCGLLPLHPCVSLDCPVLFERASAAGQLGDAEDLVEAMRL